MESAGFAEERRYFRLVAGGAVLCFVLYALVMSAMLFGRPSLPYTIYGHSWGLRLLGLICLGLSLFWTKGWKTNEHARLFGLLFLIDFCFYLFPVLSYFLSSPQMPRPELDPIQSALGVSVWIGMLVLSISFLMGGKGSRLALVVFLAAHATSVFYTQRVTIPRIQAWNEAHRLEILEQLNAQNAPGVVTELVEVSVRNVFADWQTAPFYLLAFIYVFFLKKSETRQADRSPPP